MAKPTTLPQWADNDIVNPTSGQNNVVVPGATYKTEGWGFDEIPPRQYDNWFKRWTYRWINWLDTVFGDDAKLDQDCTRYSATPGFRALELGPPAANTGNSDINTSPQTVEDHGRSLEISSGDAVHSSIARNGGLIYLTPGQGVNGGTDGNVKVSRGSLDVNARPIINAGPMGFNTGGITFPGAGQTEFADYYEGDVDFAPVGSEFGTPPATGTMHVVRIGGVVTISFAADWLGIGSTVPSLRLDPDLGGSEEWPAWMLPAVASLTSSNIFKDNSVDKVGHFNIPAGGTLAIQAYLLQVSGSDIVNSNSAFTSSVQKGIPAGASFTYHI